MILSYVCAWCNKEMDRVDISYNKNEEYKEHFISHGICEDCANKHFPYQHSLNFKENEDDD